MNNNATATATLLSERVAEEVRALMARRRISGRKLAELLGVSPSWVSYRMTGVTPIGLDDLQRIAAALNAEPADLLPRASEGRLITTAGSRPDTGGVSNARKTHPAKRPHPFGHPNRTSPRDTTRRPVRFSAAHNVSVSGGVIPMRTDREQGVTYGA